MYGLLAEEMLVAPDKSSVTFRHPSEGALLQRRPGHRAPTSSTASTRCRASRRRRPTRRRSPGVERAVVVDARTIRFDLRERSNDTVFKRRRDARRSSRRSGPSAPTASRSRSTRSSPNIRSPAGPTPSPRPTRAAASSSSAIPTTGRATCRRGAASFNFDRVVYRDVQGRRRRARGVQGRRVRHLQGVQRASPGRACTRARSGTTAGSRKTRFRPASARRCSRTSSTCAGRSSRTSACARR